MVALHGSWTAAVRRARALGAPLALVLAIAGCKPKGVPEAEAQRDVPWLADNAAPEAIAALGRLADTDPRALSALEARQAHDVNVYVAAWDAVVRSAPWGTTVLRSALADPSRAELAASSMPRRDPRLAPFVPDLEGGVVRLSAGRRGSVLAGLLASVGPAAKAAVERRLVDPKTRGVMCDGVALPDASSEAKSLVLAVPPEARDHPACVDAVLEMASAQDLVLGWLATDAEPGMLGAAAKGSLPCPRLATAWEKALTTRQGAAHAALAVPLQISVRRCSTTLDPVLAELLAKAPRSRAVIVQAIDPFAGELADMKEMCRALGKGWARGERPRIRERADDAVANGCKLAR
jgi:hypothetical protein